MTPNKCFTPGPWAWGADDYSMASLTAKGDMGEAGDMHGSHVLTVKLCKNCQKHVENSGEAADGWRFGRCATISAADAILIAAAPDMLAALKAWVEANQSIEDYNMLEDEAAARRLAVAAISKAEGRS